MKLEEVRKEDLSPMMQQYFDVKQKYQDSILFYRLGDFYEMFFDDAVWVSRKLELTLTGRDCGLPERAPMCGVPYHSYELYVKKLLELGCKVAICEQVTDPATSKGLVEREVTRVITPGTVFDMLEDASNNYLCSIWCSDKKAAVCVADLSTGEAAVYAVSGIYQREEMLNILSRYMPTEVLYNQEFLQQKEVNRFLHIRLQCLCNLQEDACFSPELQREAVCRQFSVSSLQELGLQSESPEAHAVCGLFSYIQNTLNAPTGRFLHLELSDESAYLTLDYNALKNLELTTTMRTGNKKSTLLGVLDSTRTAMGKRMLKQWIERPLRSPLAITARLDAVEALCKHRMTTLHLQDCLDNIYDLERLMTKIVYQKATPKELRALCQTARTLPELKALLETLQESSLLQRLNRNISDLSMLADFIDRAIVEEPPALLKDGHVIQTGFDEHLDALREILEHGSDRIEQICEKERQRTGIRNLKIGNNKVFGYYLEVTRSYYDRIPEDYIRKQTLANAERFITNELKEAENAVLGAKEKALQLEQDLYLQVREYLAQALQQVQETASAVAQVDVLVSFAETASRNNYQKPVITTDGILDIRNGRHPVVEQMLEGIFVPNDVFLDTEENRMSVITGPNMAGKSTYMRQTALIVLMAQMGCFVPASSASISVVDRIFTRVGASDDLTAGESTFMVEMKEVAEILRYATKDSLVILDEVGRGTSTFDGVSIAKAVAEYICTDQKLGCKTLFATHYHELITLEQELQGVRNYHVAVRKTEDGIRFLRKIMPGGTDDSYGIDVAKLAGLPEWVLSRARAILNTLESK